MGFEIAMKFGHKERFIFVILALLIADLTILLNIPFLRQVFGFIFLTIVPGLLILQLLKLTELDFLERFIFSFGLSISFLMFFGLVVNSVSLSFGYETPLSTISLLVSFNIVFIALAIIGCKTNKNFILSLPDLNLSTAEKAFLCIPILFPALSVFGMHVMNTTDNNIVLMFLLFLIPTYVVCVCFYNNKFPNRLYPVVIFLVGISLLLLISLRSNHIIGVDAHAEYAFFRITLYNLHWSIIENVSTLGLPQIFNTCLGISLLPTIYQSLLNTSPEFLFKILYSLLFSISPLVIFIISKKYVGELYAFLASLFFILYIYFV
jgi:uncharacterized membrane protein